MNYTIWTSEIEQYAFEESPCAVVIFSNGGNGNDLSCAIHCAAMQIHKQIIKKIFTCRMAFHPHKVTLSFLRCIPP